jgi:hypothetical protein
MLNKWAHRVENSAWHGCVGGVIEVTEKPDDEPVTCKDGAKKQGPIRENIRKWRILWMPLLTIIISVQIIGCPVSITSIDGVYEATLPYGVATLILRPDNSFTEIFTYKSGRKVQCSGT